MISLLPIPSLKTDSIVLLPRPAIVTVTNPGVTGAVAPAAGYLYTVPVGFGVGGV